MSTTLASSPIDRMIFRAGLVLAGVDGAAALLARFGALIPDPALRPLAFLSVVFLVFVFGRMLLDRQTHRSVRAANRDMRGDRTNPLRPPGLLDPTWGLFGERAGPPVLAFVRLFLAASFVLTLLADAHGPRPGIPLQLAFTGFFIAILLTMLQLRDHYPAADRTTLGED